MIRKSNNIAVRMSDEDRAMLEELMRSYNITTPGELMRYLIKKEHARIFIDSNARKTIATTPTKMRLPKAGGDDEELRKLKLQEAHDELVGYMRER